MLDPKQAPQSLAEMAQRSFKAFADKPFLGTKREGEYSYITYAEAGARVENIACGLLALELERGDRVLMLSENRAEWALCDLALQTIGGVTVPPFSTLPAAQVRGLLLDCGASMAFVSNAAQAKKIEEIAGECETLKTVVCFEEGVQMALPDNVAFLPLSALEARGAEYSATNVGALETIWPAAQPDDIATIIYTSGTTGEPKGAMLTHRNFLTNVLDIERVLGAAYDLKDEVFLSFLPLAHIYERTAGYYMPMHMGAAIAYCESLFTVDKNLREAKPTFMFCVPRFYETVRDKILAGADVPADKREKYQEAIQLAFKAGAHYGHGADAVAPSFVEKIKLRAYDVLVYSKIRDKFGGRLRAFISGGAPMPTDIGALFLGLGITVLEGYGLTETSPVLAVNHPGNIHLGTVGEKMHSVELKIADDGEILARGDSIFQGYWNKPQQTAEALQDGWFYTGDIGTYENGLLRITDRKKDLLVLANGKKVAPAPIEMKLAKSPYIQQAVLLGDQQKAVSAVLVTDIEALREYSRNQSWHFAEDEEMLRDARIVSLLRAQIDEYSGDLADFEKIKKIVPLAQPFSVESGELTPTLKVKRKVVAEKYAPQLEG